MSANVDAVADAVAAVSINEKKPEDAHAQSAAEGRRLYIGNLAYATTEDDLKTFFEGYSIESTSIPNNPRTGRAVGYAFVDLTTAEDAQRAIAELSGKDLVERKVSVQLARLPTAKTEEAPAAKEGEAHTEGHAKRGRGGARGRARGRGGRGGAKGTHEEHAHKEEKPINVPSQVLPLTETTNISADATAVPAPASVEKKDKAVHEHKQKEQKKRGPPENGVPSKTKVMVANLPYELSEEKLKELFADYQPESAKIALRPIPPFMVRKLKTRGEPRKGRGFGFVTLASEELQQKAVAEMDGKEVDGRQIAVKVAIDNPKIEEAAKEAAAAKAAAEAAKQAEGEAAPEEKKEEEAAEKTEEVKEEKTEDKKEEDKPAEAPAAEPVTASA